MHGFHYLDGSLHCEDMPLENLAREHGTPLYVYSAGTVRDHFRRLDAALAPLDHLVCYAVKANSNLSILSLLAGEGAGFDIVSAGELFRVIQAGGDPAKCTFAGVGKTGEEIRFALERGILAFNVESEPELDRISRVAVSMGLQAPVCVRVNPDVEAGTHKYISTGKSENKFGIAFDQIPEVYAHAAALPGIRLRGIQTHIGSQITSAKPFAEALAKMRPLVETLRDRHGLEIFSVGGGLGIVYRSSLASGNPAWWAGPGRDEHPLTVAAYAQTVTSALDGLGMKILFEPGRFLVGNAGVLLSRVEYVKRSATKTFVICNAGMNDLIRPALYEGWHEIAPLREPASSANIAPADVVGPVCESGDFFAQDRPMPPMESGDHFAILSAGAYGFAMASTYNSRPLPAEILVEGGSAKVVRNRQTLEDLIAGEC